MKGKLISKEEALSRLKHLCAGGEKCLYDVRQKLLKWNLADEVDSICTVLVNEKFIDEARYAESFVKDKVRFSKWGKVKVRYNLRMKGLSDSDIDKAMLELPQEEYAEMLRKELEKKMKSIKETDKYKKMQKAYAFAAQRGYEQDIVRALIGDLES